MLIYPFNVYCEIKLYLNCIWKLVFELYLKTRSADWQMCQLRFSSKQSLLTAASKKQQQNFLNFIIVWILFKWWHLPDCLKPNHEKCQLLVNCKALNAVLQILNFASEHMYEHIFAYTSIYEHIWACSPLIYELHIISKNSMHKHKLCRCSHN